MHPFATAIRPDATASVYQVYQAIISASGTSPRSAIDVVRGHDGRDEQAHHLVDEARAQHAAVDPATPPPIA
jgi:hypothetical protein